MNYKVVYFTRSGNSKRVAEKIANKLSCEVVQITDNKNWKGIIGFIKAGYYSAKNKEVEIKVNGNIDNADEFIAITPIWASSPVPAIKMFLKDKPLDKVHLVATSLGGGYMKNFQGYKSFSEIAKKDNNEDLVIETLMNRLKK